MNLKGISGAFVGTFTITDSTNGVIKENNAAYNSVAPIFGFSDLTVSKFIILPPIPTKKRDNKSYSIGTNERLCCQCQKTNKIYRVEKKRNSEYPNCEFGLTVDCSKIPADQKIYYPNTGPYDNEYIGTSGGTCTCPNGQVYQTGINRFTSCDNDNETGLNSKGCINGLATGCQEKAGDWSGKKVDRPDK